ncbi:hypothetical protein Tco_0401030 [Tanacetum coccineum]
MMNGKKPLTLDFNTFTTSTGLDYNNGAYVDHPSLKVVKAELSKIITNPSYLDKNPVLKNSFPVAWRILLTFVIQVDIGEIIYSDLVTKLLNKSRLRYVSYPRFISCTLEVLLGLEYTQDEIFGYLPGILMSLLPLSTKKKKGKSQTMTPTLPKSQGPEASGPCYSLMMKWFKKVMRRECLRLDEDTQEDTEVHPDLKKFDNILPLTERKPVKYLKRVSRVLFNRLTEAQWVQYEEVVVSYADLEAAIEGYYEENIDHKEQTDKVINAAMNSLDKNGIAMGDLLNALNGVTEALKAIQDTVKEEHVLNKKVLEHLASWYKSSTSMAWNLVPRMTAIESSQAEIRSEISSLKKDTSNIKSMMQRYISPLKADTKEPPSHTEGEHAAMEEEPTNAIIIDDQPEDQRNLVHASKEARLDPDAPILVPYEINGKNFQLTDEQIQAYLDKEKKIKKDSKEAKMFEMTKTEVIKVVQEEAKKIGLDPKKIISAKAGEKFKKAQDVEHQVLKREHSQKTKRAMELRMKRVEHYMWTMSNRLKPEPITDVKIHPNTKLAVLTVYRNNDKRNFEVHNLFKFGDFRITELDELGPIIEKKNKSIVKDLMTSLRKRYERLKKIPEELGIHSALPALVPGQYGIFFTDVFGDQAFQRWNDIHKVGVDSIVSYLVMALMIKTQKNVRFGLKLRNLIAEHPDQERLQSKKVKLEALGYKLD